MAGPDWRDHLHRLEGIGLVLLPIGARPPERKAPVDPKTGNGLADWPQHPGFTPAEIKAMPPARVIGAGIHTGPSGLDVLDLDGAAAVSWVAARGVDPRDPALFRITRTTDPDRFKILFRLTPEQRARLPQSKLLIRLEDGQALELYGKTGAQIVAIGSHAKSGGWYDWSGDPSQISAPSEEWFEVLLAMHAEVQQRRGKGDSSTPPRAQGISVKGDWKGSGPHHPCPVCGRDHSAACTRATSTDGRKLVSCFHGGTFSAPDCREEGQRVVGKDGREWGFIRRYVADCLGEKSLFIDHRPRPPKAKRTDPTDAFEVVEPAPEAPAEPARKASSSGQGKRQRLGPAEVLARLPDALGDIPRLNLRTREVLVGDRALSPDAVGRQYLRLSTAETIWPKDSTVDAFNELAEAHAFDPVEEYLLTTAANVPPLPLEQWERLDQHLLGIDDPIAARFLPQYLVSAVARTFRPGCGVRRSLVLIGPQQRGKSEMGRILFGPSNWVEGLKGRNDADIASRIHRAWGVELAELNGVTRRHDQEALKAFLTEKEDTFRRAYGKGEVTCPRRFVFWGTSNGPPLRDLTGSTRFVCVPIPDRMLPLGWAATHRDAIWSRAVAEFLAIPGELEPWDYVTEEERQALVERNGEHEVLDPWAERVEAFLKVRWIAGEYPVQVPEILSHLKVETERQSPALATRVRELAERAGWTYGRRRDGTVRRAGLWPTQPEPGQGSGQGGQGSGQGYGTAEPVAPQSFSEVARGARGIYPNLEKVKGEGEEGQAAATPTTAIPAEGERLPLAPLATPPEPLQQNGSDGATTPGQTPGQTPGHPWSPTPGDRVELFMPPLQGWYGGYEVVAVTADGLVKIRSLTTDKVQNVRPKAIRLEDDLADLREAP